MESSTGAGRAAPGSGAGKTRTRAATRKPEGGGDPRGGVGTAGGVARFLDVAGAVELPADREILHVLTQEFIVDDMPGIKDPRGMTGIRLDARVHVGTDDLPSTRNPRWGWVRAPPTWRWDFVSPRLSRKA